jgi:hypothetical protein
VGARLDEFDVDAVVSFFHVLHRSWCGCVVVVSVRYHWESKIVESA